MSFIVPMPLFQSSYYLYPSFRSLFLIDFSAHIDLNSALPTEDVQLKLLTNSFVFQILALANIHTYPCLLVAKDFFHLLYNMGFGIVLG